MSTRIAMDPDRPMSDYAGLPASFTTYDGETLHGITEVGSGPANGGRLIVRLSDGRWGFADAAWEKAEV